MPPLLDSSCVCYVILYHICVVTSFHVTSFHIKSFHVMSCHATLRHIISCHVTLYHVISCHVTLRHVISVISFRSCHVKLLHVISCHVLSSRHVMLLTQYSLKIVYTSIAKLKKSNTALPNPFLHALDGTCLRALNSSGPMKHFPSCCTPNTG